MMLYYYWLGWCQGHNDAGLIGTMALGVSVIHHLSNRAHNSRLILVAFYVADITQLHGCGFKHTIS